MIFKNFPPAVAARWYEGLKRFRYLPVEWKWSDRYGGNWPDLETMCTGQCEGPGWVPQADTSLPFLRCQDCNGTGKRTADSPLPCL